MNATHSFTYLGGHHELPEGKLEDPQKCACIDGLHALMQFQCHIIYKPHAVIVSCKADHDLSKVKDHPLRSHGCLSE
jgi:hypothetical protein